MKLSDADLHAFHMRCLQAAHAGHLIAKAEVYMEAMQEESGEVEPPIGTKNGSAAHLAEMAATAIKARKRSSSNKGASFSQPTHERRDVEKAPAKSVQVSRPSTPPAPIKPATPPPAPAKPIEAVVPSAPKPVEAAPPPVAPKEEVSFAVAVPSAVVVVPTEKSEDPVIRVSYDTWMLEELMAEAVKRKLGEHLEMLGKDELIHALEANDAEEAKNL